MYLVPELKVAPEKSTESEEEPPEATRLPESIVPASVPLSPPPRTVAEAILRAQVPGFEIAKLTWLPPLKVTWFMFN